MEDLTNNIYERLTVKRLDLERSCHGKPYWWCECSCAAKNWKSVRADKLKDGSVRSCGCLKEEQNGKNLGKIKHGFARRGQIAPENNVWGNMMRRCYDKEDPAYENYGARGIVVCERWHSFVNFIQDMGQRPTAKHSIERRNNNGNYCPENCVWATAKVQNRNKRNNVVITIGGQTKILKDWATEYNLDYKKLHKEYKKCGSLEVFVEILKSKIEWSKNNA